MRAAVLLACALTLLYGLVSLLRTRASLQTPVWGAVVAPEWVLVRGTRPVAVVTLAIPDVRHAGFRNASLAEKAAYAAARGYWFVACDKSLDSARTPVWTKLRLIAAVLEQVRACALRAASKATRALRRPHVCVAISSLVHTSWRPLCFG